MKKATASPDKCIMALMDNGQPCAARFVATGVMEIIRDFCIAEQARGTKPAHMITAISKLVCGIIGWMILKTAVEGKEKQATETMAELMSALLHDSIRYYEEHGI